MNMLLRIILGVVGAVTFGATLLALFRPESFAEGLGLATASAIGQATIRADFGSFFGASSVFAILGAVRGRSQYAGATLLLLSFAIAGRVVNMATVGWNPNLAGPIVIEAAIIAIFVLAYRSFLASEREATTGLPSTG
jgi:hypothetical protein